MDTSKEKPTNYYIITNNLKNELPSHQKSKDEKGAAAFFLHKTIDKNYR